MFKQLSTVTKVASIYGVLCRYICEWGFPIVISFLIHWYAIIVWLLFLIWQGPISIFILHERKRLLDANVKETEEWNMDK